MKIKYSHNIPINFIFFLCMCLLLLITIGLEVYVFTETSLIIVIVLFFIFWTMWIVRDIIQNYKMYITNLIIDDNKLMIVTSTNQYEYLLENIYIEEVICGCIKVLNVDNTFYISSAYINMKDFSYLEQKVSKKKISLNDLNPKYKVLLGIFVFIFIYSISYALGLGFDSVLYSIIGIYLGYQILKK